jgi:multicomponent Na+:H+ antiporter subunit F
LPDRVVALDLIATLVVGMIATYAIQTNQAVFLRDVIVLSVVSFLGTVAFAYYVGKGGTP